MGKQKIIQSTYREVIDNQTGEVLQVETSKTFQKKVKSQRFYITYIDYISPLYDLRSEGAKDVLSYLCTIAEFNTGKVSLTTNGRKTLCEKLKISNNSLTNYLAKLKDSNLISGNNGDFLINPQIFWKGSTEERDKILEDNTIKITFSIE